MQAVGVALGTVALTSLVGAFTGVGYFLVKTSELGELQDDGI
jgi:hypothetical protein